MPFKGSTKYHGDARERIIEETGNGSDLTADEDTEVVFADTNDSALTVTLPSGAVISGKEITVVDAGGNAGTNSITITAEGDEDVNGSDQDLTIGTNYARMELVSDGSGWWATTSAP